jgi:hypothetical protein
LDPKTLTSKLHSSPPSSLLQTAFCPGVCCIDVHSARLRIGSVILEPFSHDPSHCNDKKQ